MSCVGEKLEGFERVVTQEMVNMYADASYDHNPIHVDEEFAKTTIFGGTIAHGMLSMALLCELITKKFGNQCFTKSNMTVKFKAPVVPGEEVSVMGKVVSEDVSDNTLSVEVVLTKPDDTVAVVGTASIKVTK